MTALWCAHTSAEQRRRITPDCVVVGAACCGSCFLCQRAACKQCSGITGSFDVTLSIFCWAKHLFPILLLDYNLLLFISLICVFIQVFQDLCRGSIWLL